MTLSKVYVKVAKKCGNELGLQHESQGANV